MSEGSATRSEAGGPGPGRDGRELDVVLHGATGFTGRLVAEHLLVRHGADGDLRWALSGRSREKLERVRDELARDTGVASARELPLVVADAHDAEALAGLARRTRVVCTTVGPYALHGSELVAACAGAGTHYCDLTGEVPWMRRMIDAHESAARESGARIVHACGFDSIPSDLGTWFLQREMRERQGAPASHVKLRVHGMRGGMSGGTAASMLNILEEAGRDPAVRRLLADPHALEPEAASGAGESEPLTPRWDDDFESWTAPFVMAAINTRVVRRTRALLESRGEGYGAGFRYDEAVLTGPGPAGWLKAAAVAGGLGVFAAAGSVGPLRSALARLVPSPGEGPSRERREAGWFDLRLVGEHPHERGKSLRARVTGDRDPGYGATARMLGESAACLAQDGLAAGGGFWTPAAALGEPLLARLEAHAGLRFSLESD